MSTAASNQTKPHLHLPLPLPPSLPQTQSNPISNPIPTSKPKFKPKFKSNTRTLANSNTNTRERRNKTHLTLLEYMYLYIPGSLRPALPRDLRPFSDGVGVSRLHEIEDEDEGEEVVRGDEVDLIEGEGEGEDERRGREVRGGREGVEVDMESPIQLVTPSHPNSPVESGSGFGLGLNSSSNPSMSVVSTRRSRPTSRIEDGIVNAVNENAVEKEKEKKEKEKEKNKKEKGGRKGLLTLLSKEGYEIALVLNNSGSTARDHLASERTFLAYVRTSLALSSTGVALVQLLAISDFSPTQSSTTTSLKNKYATPLGSTLILLGILVLLQGCFRYFAIQVALTRGVFPASRIGVVWIVMGVCVIGGVVFGVLIDEKVRGRI